MACGSQPSAVEQHTTEATAVAVDPGEPEIFGCFVRRPDACLLVEGESHTLGVWLDVAPDARVQVTIDGVVVESTTRRADSGLRIETPIPAGAHMLSIAGIDPAWTHAVEVTFAPAPALPVLREAQRIFATGDATGARALLRAQTTTDPVERMRLFDMQRAFAMRSDDTAGALAAAKSELELARAHGYPDHFADAAQTIFHLHFSAGELVLARELAEQTTAAGAGAQRLAIVSNYELGLLALASGDADGAERRLAETSRLAERAGDRDYLFAADQMRAIVLAELGRAEDARIAARHAVQYASHEATSCIDRLRILDNVAWTSIRLAQAELPYDEPHDILARMLEAAAPGAECPSPEFYDEARINLALAWLVEDEPELAHEVALDLLAAHEPSSTPWVEELAAMAALGTGRWADVPELQPAQVRDPWLEWLGAVRYAETLERSGFDDAAIEAWIALEQRLDRAVRQVGVDAEQERFLAGRAVSAQRLVDLLLRGRHDDAAMCRARLAIARAVQSSDRSARTAALSKEQQAGWNAEIERYQALRGANEQAAHGEWVLPADELERVRRRRADQLEAADARIDALLGISPVASDCTRLAEPSAARPLLVAFEATDDVVVFVADEARVRTLRVPLEASLATWAALLAEPLSALEEAERVTVLAGGRAATIPFHALVHDGRTLLADTPIAYGLDLLSRPSAIDDDEQPAALVVADPRGDLEAADAEATLVEARLREHAWQVVAHRGASATREAVLAGLAESSLFHYAGHGSRGTSAWDAALRLADDTELRTGDVLTAPKVPANVVLAGCHTGRRDAATIAGGMNLGRAFVLAGADAALVADAEVGDAATRELSEALYVDATLDLPAALRRAQTRLREAGVADWSAFRVLVR